MFAVYNKHCGHVLGVHNDRAAFEPMIAGMARTGRYSLRTRKATTADILSVATSQRCEKCDFTTRTQRPEEPS